VRGQPDLRRPRTVLHVSPAAPSPTAPCSCASALRCPSRAPPGKAGRARAPAGPLVRAQAAAPGCRHVDHPAAAICMPGRAGFAPAPAGATRCAATVAAWLGMAIQISETTAMNAITSRAVRRRGCMRGRGVRAGGCSGRVLSAGDGWPRDAWTRSSVASAPSCFSVMRTILSCVTRCRNAGTGYRRESQVMTRRCRAGGGHCKSSGPAAGPEGLLVNNLNVWRAGPWAHCAVANRRVACHTARSALGIAFQSRAECASYFLAAP
jgi:hypothetical protein